MRTHALTTLLALVVSCAAPLAAAPAKNADKPAAAAAAPKGEYKGSWKGRDDSSGDLKIKFATGADAKLTAEAVFTFEGTPVPTRTKTLKIEGSRVELAFSWDVQGVSATSKLTGEIKGDRLEGTYESTTAEGPATGSWSVTRAAAGS
ncbi:MAG: hypothetical protein LW690_13825 [Opitutaceae bacterium]|nr:hypothetical protein [Opitutaceae bacterium]